MNTPFRDLFKNKSNAPAEAGGGGDGSNEAPSTEEQRVVGRIIKLSPTGYGFISSKDVPFTRIFFHWTSLRQNTLNFKELQLGQMVEFTPKQVEDKGMRAIRIVVLTNPPADAAPDVVISENVVEEVV